MYRQRAKSVYVKCLQGSPLVSLIHLDDSVKSLWLERGNFNVSPRSADNLNLHEVFPSHWRVLSAG